MTIKKSQYILLCLDAEYPGNGMNPGDPDGIWGPKTGAAVLAFQKWYGVEPQDGFLGDITNNALMQAFLYGKTVTVKEADPAILNSGSTEESTEDAAAGAEQYLQADGYYHIPRGVEVQLSPHLWASEIHCQGTGCCTESKISKRIVEMFEEIREDMGVPLEIGSAGGSGYRCPTRNADPSVGGAAGSLHLNSDAVDIHYTNPSELMACVQRHLTDGEYGLYSWGCHVGVWDRGYVNRFQ